MQVWGTLLALVLARLSFGYQLQTVSTLGPDLLAAFGIGLAALGTLMGLYLLPGALIALPCGLIARRFGEWGVVSSGLALMTFGSVVSAGAADPFMIGIGRMIAGAGAVSITVLQGKIVADRFHGPRFVTAMGLVVGVFPVGMGLAQLTQSRLAHAFGWPAAFVAGALMAGASLVLLVTTWHQPKAGSLRGFTWPSRHEVLLTSIAALIWTAYNAGYFNFLAYMPTYLAAHGHAPWEADFVVAAATWGTLPAVLLGGAVAARFGQTRVFVAGAVLNTTAVLGMYFADLPLLWGVLFGTFAAMHAGIMLAIGTLSSRPENQAVGMAFFYMIYYAGGFFIPPLCGRAAELVGDPSGAFLCAGIISAISLPLYFVHRKAKGRVTDSLQ